MTPSGYAASFFSMIEAITVPGLIEAASRRISSQCASMRRTLTWPTMRPEKAGYSAARPKT
jgi:hypothetical protein